MGLTAAGGAGGAKRTAPAELRGVRPFILAEPVRKVEAERAAAAVSTQGLEPIASAAREAEEWEGAEGPSASGAIGL